MYLDRTCPVLHWHHEGFVLWQSQTAFILSNPTLCPSSVCLQFFADCLPSGFPSFHRFVNLKSPKMMISPPLGTVSKANSGTLDGITVSAQKGQTVTWSLYWQGTEARDRLPRWVVDKNGKAWMESFDSFRSWLSFCSWSSLRKDPWRSQATAAALAEDK